MHPVTISAPVHRRSPRSALGALGLAVSISAGAQGTVVLDPVVVTATRTAERSFDVPASVDRIDAATLHDGQPMVNLSETLLRVPGIVALNRQNYAQDLQISSRGFGARSTFGVRGIRLYQDDIPATMPDGQGQAGSFSLFSAQRIEVLRGPFSTLYGNAAGGVIAIYTEDGTATPEVTGNVGAGSYGSYTLGAKLTGSAGAADGVRAGYVGALSRFGTDGYREHSRARRDLANAKLTLDLAPGTRIAVVASGQGQPETQDPLGLTRAQWEADPRSVDPAALQFDTRKTIRQQQGGITLDQRLTDSTSVKVIGYSGGRAIRQYLALNGIGPTSSGGVTDLDRGYGGVAARLTWRGAWLGGPLQLIGGLEADRQAERRRGYVNDDGALGELRRDEDDVVQARAAYAQAEWSPWAPTTFTAGVRSSRVSFSSDDHYVTAANPDDSGATQYRNTSPVLGMVLHASDRINVYASYGEGFETPSLIELAYRTTGTGLNFALQPATSRAAEVGLKALLPGRQRVNLALFDIRTDDEIVIDASTGGRTTYKNAGRTSRRGVELAWDATLLPSVTAHVAYTYLRAVFASDFSTGTPPVPVPSGTRLPGVPAHTGYAEVAWRPATVPGLAVALEVQHVGAIAVNDRNTDAAPAWTIGNARVEVERALLGADWHAFVRLNNFTDRHYAGSVIVGDTSGRFFEPAPGRNWYAGLSAHVGF